MSQLQTSILSHIDAKHQETVTELIAKLDTQQLETVELLLDAADQQQIAQWQGEQLILLTQQALVDLNRLRQAQPDADQWLRLDQLLARETGWEQKLKLTLPLVPGIIEFESEVGVDVIPTLKETWQRLINKVQRKGNA